MKKPILQITHPDNQVSQATQAKVERFNQFTVTTYGRPDLVLSHGKGCYVYDTDGRQFLDFTAGIAVNALGHSDPEVAQVLYEQANKLVHISNLYHNENAGVLAENLVTTTRENDGPSQAWASKVFLSNSGTEANEGALKFARKWGKHVSGPAKHKIVCFSNAFHGRSFGALSATPKPKYQDPFTPLVPGFSTVPYNDIEQAVAAITDETCGVIMEPIQGEGGIHPASQEFISAVRKRCTEKKALLIYDEIQCGLGRTGKLWGYQQFEGVQPDILTMAKPLANGVPIGAIMTNEAVGDMIKLGEHGTTFGGNPLATAVALNVFKRISDPTFMETVQRTGQALKEDLQTLQQQFPDVIKEVRGKGLLIGVEFTKDPAAIVKMARERGLLLVTAGCNTVRVIPPLILSKEDAQEGVARFAGAVEEFSKTL
ncbi:acetylornithine aminotransferase [Apophysomyces sp. BC1034]|nr:acetylornithine aminotransferase [Apophysomyces sp. BC1015]KAG0183002.1 acetylornithine aminotransferase [Apophysomyces sp. BC1021]KAG0194764.1 acetylornithine aminotransferase [Apophysomyces sp. BC1034]